MTAGTSARFRIGDREYGFATTAVQEILDKAASHHWFPETDHAQLVNRVESLATDHVDALVDGGVWSQRNLSHEFVRGGPDVLAAAYRKCNPGGLADDPAYARGAWRGALGELAENARRYATKSGTQMHFVPPLFPIERNPVVVGEMLTARYDQLGAIVEDVQHRSTVWYAMCAVDGDFWDAILWEIAYQDVKRVNPFSFLLELYLLGYYPLGSVGESYLIYSYA